MSDTPRTSNQWFRFFTAAEAAIWQAKRRVPFKANKRRYGR